MIMENSDDEDLSDDGKGTNDISKSGEKPVMNKKVLNCVVITIFLCSLLLNVDMGILPAGEAKIREENGMTHGQYGLLGGIDYAG
jgi:hypothetical protein